MFRGFWVKGSGLGFRISSAGFWLLGFGKLG